MIAATSTCATISSSSNNKSNRKSAFERIQEANSRMGLFDALYRLHYDYRDRDRERHALELLNMTEELTVSTQHSLYLLTLTDSFPFFPVSASTLRRNSRTPSHADPLGFGLDFRLGPERPVVDGPGLGPGLGLENGTGVGGGNESAFGTPPPGSEEYEGDWLAHLAIYAQTHFVYPLLIFLGVLFNSLALMTLLRKHVRSNLTYFRCAIPFLHVSVASDSQ